MRNFRDRDTEELIWLTVTWTLCLCLLLWVGFSLVRWVTTPNLPEPPTGIDISIESCKKNGGVPYTKWISIDGYQKEILDRCTKDPVQQ